MLLKSDNLNRLYYNRILTIDKMRPERFTVDLQLRAGKVCICYKNPPIGDENIERFLAKVTIDISGIN